MLSYIEITQLIGVEGDPCGISVTDETSQKSVSDRGDSPHAPRKASAQNGNQRCLQAEKNKFKVLRENTLQTHKSLLI